jgi:hypothetical protein
MKPNKPYLSLSKKTNKYELEVVVATERNQTITGIHQKEVKSDNETCPAAGDDSSIDFDNGKP